MNHRIKILASLGLALGAVFGLAGNFAPSASLRGLAWGIDGLGLVMASALLALTYFRRGQDLVAAGFLVFLVGQSIIVSGAAMDLASSVPSFGAGVGMWALALGLISAPDVFPFVVRLLGLTSSALFATTAVRIFTGAPILPTSQPLPFYIYPLFVATLIGWIVTFWRLDGGRVPRSPSVMSNSARE
jgi:hypothetical protein